MNKFSRSSRVLLPLALSAALALSGCQSDGTPVSESTASSSSSNSTAATAEQTSAVLSSLTDTELQELISGSATLEQLAQQRTEASSTASASSGTAASAPEASAAAAESAASTAETAPAAYEQELKALINQLYDVKARAEAGLNSAIKEATAEYKALPANKQTKARKISICMGKASQLKALESSCDKEVADIVAKMRALLIANGQSTALADEAEATYKAQKSAMYASLTSKLYG